MPSLPPDHPDLPPSPHREKILEFIEKGRAHVEAQGHGQPALLVFEDGGMMELSRFRWVEGTLASDDSPPAGEATRYSDVCTTIDELKRLLGEGLPVQDPETVERLLAEALGMIDRMRVRLEEYHRFRQEVEACLRNMEALTGPDCHTALEAADRLRTGISETTPAASVETLWEEAEAVRSVAQRLEDALYPLRDACIEIGRLYEGVRGARQWRTK